MSSRTKRISPELVAAIRSISTAAICCHVNPDGDTIGSALSLRLGLLAMGKQVRVFCQDKVPDILTDLPGADTVETVMSLKPADHFDAVIPVDISDDYRMGDCLPLLEHGDIRLLIDHHGTNPGFGDINVVDEDASATCLLIAELLKQLDVTITPDMARCLYAGISTDTGNFSFRNTTPEAFRVTAELMETGFPMSEMNRKLFRERDRAQLLLIRRALDTLSFAHGYDIAFMMLRRSDFADCGALEEHADTIVNFGMDLKGAKMALLAREDRHGGIKMSLRSIAPWRVDGIAHKLGGGGHDQAAGCTLTGTLEACTERVVACMIAGLDEMET